MALIKCPECNNDVSTEATSCPHCGYPVSKVFDNNLNKKYPSPISDKWIKEWKKVPTQAKLIVFGFFVVSIVMLFIFILFLNIDLETEYNSIGGTIYSEKNIWIVLTGVASFFTFFLFVSVIVSLFTIKIHTKNIDGYNVVVYCGILKNYLIIENEEYDSNWGSVFHNTLLVGELPNGKQLIVTLSSGSVSFRTEELSNRSSNENNYINNSSIDSKDLLDLKNKTNENKLSDSSDKKVISDDTQAIINSINEDLLMLSYVKDSEKIKTLKTIINIDYQKLLKCPDIDKDNIEKIKKKIKKVFDLVSKH